jgi:hypothetical protein
MDHDRGGCVFGDVAGIRDYDSNCLTDIKHFITRQNVLRANLADRRIGQQHRHRLAAHRLRQIVRRDHRIDTGHCQRRRAIDGLNFGVGIGRADKAGMQRVWHLQVIDKTAASGEQRRIFEPLYARTEDVSHP